MTMSQLSDQALAEIETYMHLPIGNKKVQCPYFNNKRSQVRAGLRVTIGKGSIKDIVDEVELFALREKIDLSTLSENELKEYLVKHNLGVDCSGFVYHILDEETRAQGKGAFKKILSYPFIKNPLRKLLTKLRPAENVNVKTLAHEKNTIPINLKDVKAGDLITIQGAGYTGVVDHVLLIHQVTYADGKPAHIGYSHSYQWSSDGRFGHGVRQGHIDIKDIDKPLLEQHWEEQGIHDERKNETFRRASEAKNLEIRRLKALA